MHLLRALPSALGTPTGRRAALPQPRLHQVVHIQSYRPKFVSPSREEQQQLLQAQLVAAKAKQETQQRLQQVQARRAQQLQQTAAQLRPQQGISSPNLEEVESSMQVPPRMLARLRHIA